MHPFTKYCEDIKASLGAVDYFILDVGLEVVVFRDKDFNFFASGKDVKTYKLSKEETRRYFEVYWFEPYADKFIKGEKIS